MGRADSLAIDRPMTTPEHTSDQTDDDVVFFFFFFFQSEAW